LQRSQVPAVAQPVAISGDVAGTLDANYYKGCGSANYGEREVVAQPVSFRDPCPTLTAKMQGSSGWAPANEDAHLVGVAQPVATDLYNGAIDGDATHSLRVGNGNAMGGVPSVMAAMQVRRLTPVECERLQGFPDNYTRIPWKLGYWAADKHSPEVLETIAKQCPDGPRYKALGNSMAVPVMRWIGKRIQKVHEQ
jgi:DNA (cytosine-5)-methyltransferase 1